MTTIGHLLHDDSIRLDALAADWREAIRIAGRLLEDRGAIDEAYTSSMITSIEEKGPYIVISPGFAFAHARPSGAVHRTEMSWVRLAEPVEFGHDKNDPVSLVVALAAVDSKAHTRAMAQLAKIIGSADKRRALDTATSSTEVRAIIEGAATGGHPKTGPTAVPPGGPTDEAHLPSQSTAPGSTRDRILTVCGNGLGTSLFLKNTLEQVLDAWGWGPYITVEATDTISAKGKAKEADCILTSGEIARTLGDPGVPVHVIENFTSAAEVDAALRSLYDV